MLVERDEMKCATFGSAQPSLPFPSLPPRQSVPARLPASPPVTAPGRVAAFLLPPKATRATALSTFPSILCRRRSAEKAFCKSIATMYCHNFTSHIKPPNAPKKCMLPADTHAMMMISAAVVQIPSTPSAVSSAIAANWA